jgi:hypothetical protein
LVRNACGSTLRREQYESTARTATPLGLASLSAGVEWSYVQVAHQIDELPGVRGERLVGAVVADCGCGPGVVTEKLRRLVPRGGGD